MFEAKELPFIIAYNKSDLLDNIKSSKDNQIYISAKDKINIYELKEKIGKLSAVQSNEKKIGGRFIKRGRFCGACCADRLICAQGQAYSSSTAGNKRYS